MGRFNLSNKDNLLKALNGALLVCCLCNFLVLGWSVKNSTPQIEEHTETIVSNFVIVVTQVVENVSSSSSLSSAVTRSNDLRLELQGVEFSAPYKYFMVDGVRMISFFGRNFTEGSPTSYGVIDRIFPDRVKLVNGAFIKNSSFDVPNEVVKNE